MLTFQLFDVEAGQWVTQGHDESIRIITETGQTFKIVEYTGKHAEGGIQILTPNAAMGMAPVSANSFIMKEIK